MPNRDTDTKEKELLNVHLKRKLLTAPEYLAIINQPHPAYTKTPNCPDKFPILQSTGSVYLEKGDTPMFSFKNQTRLTVALLLLHAVRRATCRSPCGRLPVDAGHPARSGQGIGRINTATHGRRAAPGLRGFLSVRGRRSRDGPRGPQ